MLPEQAMRGVAVRGDGHGCTDDMCPGCCSCSETNGEVREPTNATLVSLIRPMAIVLGACSNCAMAWLVKLMKHGKSVPDCGPFDTAYVAVEAGNLLLQQGDADDVTISNREHVGIYYQFGSTRTSSEALHIGRLLEAELVAGDRA